MPGETLSSYGRHCGEGLLEPSLLSDFCVFIDFIFLNSFRFTAKLNREYKRVLIHHLPPKPPTPAPTHAEPPPLSTSSTRVVCLFQLMNLHDTTLSSKPIVYIRIHSWCCTFCGFGQMYNDMHPPLLCHTEQFHCLKNPLCSTYYSLSSPKPWQSLNFLLSSYFCIL